MVVRSLENIYMQDNSSKMYSDVKIVAAFQVDLFFVVLSIHFIKTLLELLSLWKAWLVEIQLHIFRLYALLDE